jgi:hypothetical protein
LKDAPPRIHTLRNDGETPKTSDCFTPRTMEGNDGAFKGEKYGSFLEGPYRNPDVWTTRIMWVVVICIILLGLTVLVLKL